MKNYGSLLKDPYQAPIRVWGMYLAWRLSLKSNVDIAGKINITGTPLIDIDKSCTLVIGTNVSFNSRNRGYHINMHSPVKLFADRPNARIQIGDNTRIHGTCIHSYESIIIGNNCLIAANCQIFDGNGHDLSFSNVENRITTVGSSKPINIENNVWIGANSIILPGVTIGEGAVISANSVVSKNIPPMVLAGGNPAIIIRRQSILNTEPKEISDGFGSLFSF